MRLLSALVAFGLVLISQVSFSQRYAVVPNGAWTSAATWAATPNGAGGAGVPTATDDVYTNTRQITVTGTVNCRNLYVSHATANSITLDPLANIRVSGTLNGYDDGAGEDAFPEASVFSFGGGSRITFLGTNIQEDYSPYVIYYWNTSVPLGRAYFDFGVGQTRNLILSISIGELARVVSGTLDMDPNAVLSGASAALEIQANGILDTDHAIGPFNTASVTGVITTSSSINSNTVTVNTGGSIVTSGSLAGNTLTVNTGGSVTTNGTISVGNMAITGTVTSTNSISATSLTVNNLGLLDASGIISTTNTTITGTITTSNALNTSTNFTMNSTGVLNTSYIGGAGWYTTTAPGTINLNPTSTVNFSANGAQNIPIATYGHLTLSGSGNKTASGSGSLTFAGNVNNTSSSVTFSPTQDVLFTGSAALQTISGTGTINFASGLEIDKTSGSVNLNRSITVSGGLAVSSGTFNLGSQTLTLQSGNITNAGTFTPATSTIIINGATQLNGSIGFHNLTIGASGSLQALASSMNISGNLTNNGSANAFNANSGTLAFNGTSDQTITGSFTLNNITCTNSGTNGVLVPGTVNLVGTLTLSSGKFDADGLLENGSFTIRSTGLGSGGRIATLGTPGNFSGVVTVERYVNAPEDYRYLAVPVNGANLGSWKDDIAITGNFSDATTPAQNPNVVSASAASVFTFNAATQSFTAVGNGGGPVAGVDLLNTRAYVAWTYLSTDRVIDMTGTIGKSNISLNGLTPNQYNLVPNPYPSAIDWDLVNRTGFSNTMYMTTGQGTFATYTPSGGFGVNHPNNDWTGEIALGQSFYVLSTGGNSLGLTESVKTATYDFVRENQASDYFKVRLQGPNNADELGIAFRDNATLEFDEEFDALKKTNPDGMLNFSSYNVSAAGDLAINIVPKIGPQSSCNLTIKLKMTEVVNGEHTISFSQLDKMLLGYEIVLKDNYANVEKTVDASLNHTFTVDTGTPATFADGRFEIRLTSPQIDPTFNFGLTSDYDCNSEFVRVNFAQSQLGVKYLFKLNDVSLNEPVQANGSNDVVLIPKSALQYGANMLTLVAATVKDCDAYIYNNAVSVNYHELNAITSVTPASRCDAGSMTIKANGAAANGSYRWYESENAVDPLEGQFASSFTTPELSESKTYFVTALNSNGCESLTRTPVTATVTNKTEISSVVNGAICGQGQAVLQAGGAPAGGSYRWYEAEVGGTAIPEASNARFTTPVLTQSKTYYVTALTSSGCESDIRIPVVATVNTLPAASIVVNGFDLSVMAGDNQVQWYKNGVEIEGETSSVFSVRESGTYSVKLINGAGCSTTSEGMEFIVLGVEDNYSKHGFTVHPNPTEGLITIEGSDIASAGVSLFDTNGKQVDPAVFSRKVSKSVTADITKYPKGLYIISIQRKNSVVQFKVIKK